MKAGDNTGEATERELKPEDLSPTNNKA